jgi:hypothetical protein
VRVCVRVRVCVCVSVCAQYLRQATARLLMRPVSQPALTLFAVCDCLPAHCWRLPLCRSRVCALVCMCARVCVQDLAKSEGGMSRAPVSKLMLSLPATALMVAFCIRAMLYCITLSDSAAER